MLIDIRPAGVGGLSVGIFSSLQGWLCVLVLCALQCAKNSVGSGRQNHVNLNLSRMLFRVTYNFFVQAQILRIIAALLIIVASPDSYRDHFIFSSLLLTQ